MKKGDELLGFYVKLCSWVYPTNKILVVTPLPTGIYNKLCLEYIFDKETTPCSISKIRAQIKINRSY